MAQFSYYSFIFWVFGVIFCCRRAQVESYTKFTNFKCQTFDKPFADFRHCNLKVIQRGIVALNMHVELYQVPVSNITFNLSLLKKFNIYRPFLYNYTADFCKFMAYPRVLSFAKIFANMILETSNVNHTCPYNHDIIVKNLTLKDEYFRLMPLPIGEYMLNIKVGAYNDWKAEVKTYILVELD